MGGGKEKIYTTRVEARSVDISVKIIGFGTSWSSRIHRL